MPIFRSATSDSLNEIARPEWNIKYLYFDAFEQAARNFQNYEVARAKGNPATGQRIEWLASLRRIGIILWAKINKVPDKAEEFWPNLWKISNWLEVTDQEAYQAMKETAVLYEKYGYTKIETESVDMWKTAVEDR